MRQTSHYQTRKIPLLTKERLGEVKNEQFFLHFHIGGSKLLNKHFFALVTRLILLGLILSTLPANAQTVAPTYAIVGAKIEIGDGRVIEKGTVVIRDGRIVAVGKDIVPPPAAEIIKGEGLVVYPGFIDAWSSAGVSYPEAQPTQDEPIDTGSQPQISMRDANRNGIRPQLRAYDYLSLSASQANDLRKQGFTTQWIVPSGGTLNGFGTLVNLSGHPKRESVILEAVGAGFSFASGRAGGYPYSLMGVFSHLRQTLLDAQRLPLQLSAYQKGAGRRPPSDDALKALNPTLQGKIPALFEADTEREVVRAVRFCDEFKLRPILVGGLEAYQQAALLGTQKIPLLLSLNYGKEPAAPTGDDDTPKAVFAEKKRLWEEQVANAIGLNKAGVVFAFTTRGLKNTADFWENLRRVIKAGLPREAALRALSLNAAQLLGQEKVMGTVEEGKTALLTIMNGDFADAKSKTTLVFIDGEKFEVDKEKPATVPTTPRPRRRTDDEENR